MNQTQKRLKIINLAISITDIDTIQLQILKLNQIKTDTALQEIITTLQSNNYAKAQSLIREYLKNPPEEEVIQRVENIDTPSNLYKEIPVNEPPIEIRLEDMLKIQNENYQQEIQNSIQKDDYELDFESLLNITQDDVMKNNISIDITSSNQNSNNFDENIELINLDIPKDDYFDEKAINTTQNNTNNNIPQNEFENIYETIPYINEKFQNILQQYPQVQPKLIEYENVNKWLQIIKNEGYSEANVEEIIDYVYKVSQKDKSEAAQLLLLSACTKSKYAQFMLARELYRGNLIKQNIQQSFDIMYKLAINENYPEAICDLAQFYEHGIGVKADKDQAFRLYDEAMQLGITRAIKHYDRLSKQKKKLFNIF
jgi:hypothetical protein